MDDDEDIIRTYGDRTNPLTQRLAEHAREIAHAKARAWAGSGPADGHSDPDVRLLAWVFLDYRERAEIAEKQLKATVSAMEDAERFIEIVAGELGAAHRLPRAEFEQVVSRALEIYRRARGQV